MSGGNSIEQNAVATSADERTEDEKVEALASEIVSGFAPWVGSLVTSFLAVAAIGSGSAFATLMPVTWYRLQTDLGLALCVPFAGVVAAELFFLSKLTKDPNPRVRKLGRGLTTAFQYTALFQGLVMTATVIWMIAIVAGNATAPTSENFAEDFVIGVGYVSCFVYGATGLTVLTGASRALHRWAGTLFALATIALPIVATTAYGDELREACAENPNAALAVTLGYFLIASIAGMGLMEWLAPSAPQQDEAPTTEEASASPE